MTRLQQRHLVFWQSSYFVHTEIIPPHADGNIKPWLGKCRNIWRDYTVRLERNAYNVYLCYYL